MLLPQDNIFAFSRFIFYVVTYLLFADDAVLLASSIHDLQLHWSGPRLSVKQLG